MRILIFTVLKLVEGLAIVFIPYYIGAWNPMGVREDFLFFHGFDQWLCGLATAIVGIIIVALMIGAGMFLVGAVRANWEWAGRIKK